jgi:hypothetical protein
MRCDAETQKLVIAMTYEELITTQNGINASRALVNVVIDQQIGQQISVCFHPYPSSHVDDAVIRWTPSAKFCNKDAALSAVPMTLCCTRHVNFLKASAPTDRSDVGPRKCPQGSRITKSC